MKTDVLQIRIEKDLGALIESAVSRTGLSKSELIRQGLRKGLPRVVDALQERPKRNLLDALRELRGIEIPERTHRFKRRP